MTNNDPSFSRRAFLKGAAARGRDRGTSDCVSSAVVAMRPGREQEVLGRLSAMPGVEVRACEASKAVLVLEGPGNGAVGAMLAEISVMEGVICANMVFEHTETVREDEGGVFTT